MKAHASAPLAAGRKARRPHPRHAIASLAIVLTATPLGACQDQSPASVDRALYVRTEVVRPQDHRSAATLTGEVQARFRADLAFRVSGRVIERPVDVGTHVAAGDLLARLDPAEQQADLQAAIAGEAAAQAQLRLARVAFERQKTLISEGFTTRTAFDRAWEALQTAEGRLESAKAELGRAKDALGNTELRAGAAGVITARHLEVGQVVQSAQRVLTLAQDGPRDAVFDVDESLLFGTVTGRRVALTLVSDPSVTATGQVREVSPAVDAKSSTVRVKVTIQDAPAAMTLGSAVAGTFTSNSAAQISVPWTALMASGSTPAVWIVDPLTGQAVLKRVAVGGFEAGTVVIKAGLKAGERVVIDGGKLLSPGQVVTYDGRPS